MEVQVFALVMGGGATAARKQGMSGGDRIIIECSRRWARRGVSLAIHTTENGRLVYARYVTRGVQGPKIISHASGIATAGTAIATAFFIAKTTFVVPDVMQNIRRASRETVFYSASDLWPDVLAGYLAKKRVPRCKWIGTLYQFAPSPLNPGFPYRTRNLLRGLLLYLAQRVSLMLLKRADMIWVTNPLDQKAVSSLLGLPLGRVIAVKGGVDHALSAAVPETSQKLYDAVFIGRLHPQKGALELLDIWKIVVERRPGARLAIIGDGYLEGVLREKAHKLGLESLVSFCGFVDGVEKVRIFKASRIVVHPAIYDSGGMAACEAMVCGLPGVSFDLDTLREYYPVGMLKAPVGNYKEFATLIIRLLEDEVLYSRLSQEARSYAETWDWDARARELLHFVESLLSEKPASRTL